MSDFARFWNAYPKRVARKKAELAWQKLQPSPALVEQILAALAWQVTQESWLRDDGQYIPYPASWLNGERWLDERRVSERRRDFQWTCPHTPECTDGKWRCHQRTQMDATRRAG